MANRWDKQSYEYEGTDPFNLEDDAFPVTVGLIEIYAGRKQVEVVDELLETLSRPDTRKVLLQIKKRLEDQLPK